MDARILWSRILFTVGGIAMLVGAIDPMEGSLLILPGSGLVALGTFLGQSERRLIAYRVWRFRSDCDWCGGVVGPEHGWRHWRLFWSFALVGSADAALSDWLVDGYLGAGIPALDAVAGHRRGLVVFEFSGDRPAGR